MPSSAIQFDKFTSGSHSAKNAVGISRKDIIHRTSKNMQDMFEYPRAKASLEKHLTRNGGKLLGTRKITAKGVKLNLPVYELGTDTAAEYALVYAVSDMPKDMSINRKEVVIVGNSRFSMAGMALHELQAWHAYMSRRAAEDVEQNKRPYPKEWTEHGAKWMTAEAENKEFAKWMTPKIRELRAAALTQEQRTMLTSTLPRTSMSTRLSGVGLTIQWVTWRKSSERWAARLAKKAEFDSRANRLAEERPHNMADDCEP